MKLDIIIPAYNAHGTIDKALASIATQKLDSEDEMRVIIVNDASPDGDYNACAAYWSSVLHVAVVNKKVNGGCGQARQTGMDVSDADAVMFVDADDVLGSPFACRTLLAEIKNGCDMAVGEFIEETIRKTIVNHGMNWIWCHGKMYSLKFIREHDIRFNLTRGNEDVGFNSVFHALTDNIVYIPQVVYIWQNYSESTVRKDADGYSYDYGWRDFIENMAWAVEEMGKRGVSEDFICDFDETILARMYYQFAGAHKHFPEKDGENIAKLREFWERACAPYAEKLTDEGLEENFLKLTMQDGGNIITIPHLTYEAFLKELQHE